MNIEEIIIKTQTIDKMRDSLKQSGTMIDYGIWYELMTISKQNEKIIRGEYRKIVVTFKSINTSKPILFDEVFYRMYIKEGRTNVIVHDWTQIDVTNENSFTLDTSIYIPREYFLEIKGKTHTEEILYENEIKFDIVSEK